MRIPSLLSLVCWLSLCIVPCTFALQAEIELKDQSLLVVTDLSLEGGELQASFRGSPMNFDVSEVQSLFFREPHVLKLKDGRRFAVLSQNDGEGWLRSSNSVLKGIDIQQIASLEYNPTYLQLFSLKPQELQTSREFGPLYNARMKNLQQTDKVADVQDKQREEPSMPVAAVERVKRLRQRFLAKWDGRVDVSFQSWEGNKSFSEADLALKAEQDTANGRLLLDGIGSFDDPEVGQKDTSAYLRAKWDFNQVDHQYNFYLLRLGISEFDDVPNSQVLGYGLGWEFKRSAKELFRFSIGLTGTRENRHPEESTELSSVFGIEYKKPLGSSLRFESDFNFYPSLENFDDGLLADGTVSLFIPVSRTVDWKLSYFGRYNEQVKPGEENLDTRFTSSVSYKF